MFDNLFDKMNEVQLFEGKDTKYSLSRDANGNKLLKVSMKGAGGFSVQTNSNMPKTHSMKKGNLDNGVIASELKTYVTKHGTKRQKEILGVKDESK